MHEYRQSASGENEESSGANAAIHGTERPQYMSLAEQYGLEDMDDGNPDENTQTVEQEYQAYVTALPSPKSVDILKFWEVRDVT